MAASIIVRDPEILGGIPCFRGTRVPFQNLLDYLEAGDTLDEFLEQFETLAPKVPAFAWRRSGEPSANVTN